MSTFTRDEIALALVRHYGVPTDRAKRAAALIIDYRLDRPKNPGGGVTAGPQADDDPFPVAKSRRSPASAAAVRALQRNRTEAEVQIEGVRALRDNGWHTWRVGQRDARGTQDAGVADVLAFNIENPSPIKIAFVEYKREKGGKQSESQRIFQSLVGRLGTEQVKYFLARSLDDIAELLTPEL